MFILAVGVSLLPIAIAYGCELDDWTMIRFWLWFMVNVIGWFMAMSIALDAPAAED